jgi:hypothetical protein
LAASVVRSLQTPQPIRALKALPSKATNGKTTEEDKTLFDEPEAEIVEPDGSDDGDNALDAEDVLSSTAPKEPRAPKKVPVYQFVTNLNLRPEEQTSLKDFYAQKKPEDQQERFALIVFYMARELKMAGISANHIYTALQEVKQRVPTDILQICRNIKSRKGWIDPSDGDNVLITTQGENFVNHELPKQPAA